MSLACGIVGLPNCGKTTIFNAITASKAQRASFAFSTVEPNVAVVEVPDERLAVLNRFIETKKRVHAQVQVVDIAGLAKGAARGEGMGNKFLGRIKETDALLHVVQCFERSDLGREGPVDPAGDVSVLELELALADLDTVTRAVDRSQKKARGQDKQAAFEAEVQARARELLEAGKQLRLSPWKPAELEALRPLFLLTMKPVLYVANTGEEDPSGAGPHALAVRAIAEATGSDFLAVCGDIECELATMATEERAAFQSDYGIAEPALPRLIRTVYHLLGLQSFFTAGEKEIRAWTIRRGDTAPVAAGKIHSDFEKGFIRAEIYSVEDLVAHRTEVAIRAAGRMRAEGRDYVMQEADVCHFLVGK